MCGWRSLSPDVCGNTLRALLAAYTVIAEARANKVHANTVFACSLYRE